MGQAILDKAMMATRAREAARKARESIRRKTALERQPPCRTSCATATRPTPSSPSSTSSRATPQAAPPSRAGTRRFQAILPLWGKMLNVEKARADKVYGNDKLHPGHHRPGRRHWATTSTCSKLRYHKVVIMADADVDGCHIRTLLLTFFFRFMRPAH